MDEDTNLQETNVENTVEDEDADEEGEARIKSVGHTKCGDCSNDLNLDTSEPVCKIAKLGNMTTADVNTVDFTINSNYTVSTFRNFLEDKWSSLNVHDRCTDPLSGAQIHSKPFELCVLPNFLADSTGCSKLVEEIVNKVQWSRKQMDLYEFYQSTDLSNMTDCIQLEGFFHMLRDTLRPWIEKVSNQKLDFVSASCSMYNCGDYLLAHDDLLKDRQIAFVYYLTPWENNTVWRPDQGGCLELFESFENCFPQFPVHTSISPKNNQLVLFKVSKKSFHQVGEVTTFDYPRLTINGWFHGSDNSDIIAEIQSPVINLQYNIPIQLECSLNTWLNDVYLKPTTKRSIQKRVEDNSEICLYEFFRQELFELVQQQLLTDKMLKWIRQGPANLQNYEILDLSTASNTISSMVELLLSTKMFELLKDYTDLDLSGSNAVKPTCSIQVQRWQHGDYTVFCDSAISSEDTLDLVYYLNASEGAAVITYLTTDSNTAVMQTKDKQQTNAESDTDSLEGSGFNDNEGDDDSVLLIISPVNNALNIVYCTEGTAKFTKYISRITPMEPGPVFVIACSYKE